MKRLYPRAGEALSLIYCSERSRRELIRVRPLAPGDPLQFEFVGGDVPAVAPKKPRPLSGLTGGEGWSDWYKPRRARTERAR